MKCQHMIKFGIKMPLLRMGPTGMGKKLRTVRNNGKWKKLRKICRIKKKLGKNILRGNISMGTFVDSQFFF